MAWSAPMRRAGARGAAGAATAAGLAPFDGTAAGPVEPAGREQSLRASSRLTKLQNREDGIGENGK